MDACSLIQERLAELGYDQKDLAAATGVTESYISQILTRKKTPPASNRTDIYEKMEAFLELPAGRLSQLADRQRLDELRENLRAEPAPLNPGIREFVLFKCQASSEAQVRSEFNDHTFGLAERLVTQTLMNVAKDTVREELPDKKGIRTIAKKIDRSLKDTRVIILDFLDTDVFNLAVEHCKVYLDPLIESWSIDFANFRIEVVLDTRLSRVRSRQFEFVESGTWLEEPGFKDFLRDGSLSGDASEQEIAFLRSLRFDGRHPTPYYYYRELQNLRDPLHFRELT